MCYAEKNFTLIPRDLHRMKAIMIVKTGQFSQYHSFCPPARHRHRRRLSS